MKEPFDLINILKKKFKGMKFIKTKKMVYKITQDFSLVIETYLSTGFLETMSQNRPAIVLLNEKMINLDKDAINIFKKLKNVNICFTDMKKAASFLSSKVNNLEDWWNDKKLQRVRSEFCEKYARNPINDTFLLSKKISLLKKIK